MRLIQKRPGYAPSGPTNLGGNVDRSGHALLVVIDEGSIVEPFDDPTGERVRSRQQLNRQKRFRFGSDQIGCSDHSPGSIANDQRVGELAVVLDQQFHRPAWRTPLPGLIQNSPTSTSELDTP